MFQWQLANANASLSNQFLCERFLKRLEMNQLACCKSCDVLLEEWQASGHGMNKEEP